MNCPNPNCKATGLPDDARFCPDCGLSLKPQTPQHKKPELMFGPYGKVEGLELHVETCQMQHSEGAREFSICRLRDHGCKDNCHITAHTSDNKFTFEFTSKGELNRINYSVLDESGVPFAEMTYHCTNSLSRNIWGIVIERSEREQSVWYDDETSKHSSDNNFAEEWHKKYGKFLMKDLQQSRNDFITLLGFDPIHEHYWEWETDERTKRTISLEENRIKKQRKNLATICKILAYALGFGGVLAMSIWRASLSQHIFILVCIGVLFIIFCILHSIFDD